MTADLAVIGLGYVGLPLAQEAVRAGMKVIGFDIHPGVVDGLNSGTSHVDDLSDADIAEMVEGGFRATTDPDELASVETIVICVPTPLAEDGGPDLGAVKAAVATVARRLQPGMLVVLESTTYPGTTDEIVRPALEAGGLEAGKDFFLAFSPERIDPGNPVYGMKNTPKVVGGQTPECTRRAAEFYGKFVDTVVEARGTREAETAKLLNPEKMVLLPAENAGCSLAASITAEDVRRLKAQYPGVPVVTYVNTYADVKAESDICCTSGNAVEVVNSFDSDTIIFLPDEYLAKNVAKETGKRIIVPSRMSNIELAEAGADFDMIGWHGRCEVHEQFTVQDVADVRAQFPDVAILAHPECSPEVVAASDFSGSTTAMIRFVEQTAKPHYLLLTECSMGDNVAAANPHKDMLRLCSVRCPHMNQITLEDTLEALRKDQYQIHVPEEIRVRAAQAVQRMIAIG